LITDWFMKVVTSMYNCETTLFLNRWNPCALSCSCECNLLHLIASVAFSVSFMSVFVMPYGSVV